jgi:putative phosphoribosyl transferase
MQEVVIPFERFQLNGELAIPPNSLGVILFAHGSGSSRHSPRNQFVARALRDQGVGTLLFDLLTEEEEAADRVTGHLRFDIGLLGQRLLGATRWYHRSKPDDAIGYFGSSTGSGASLLAETQSELPIKAIVSRGGRPDLAGTALSKVRAPTLLIVGGNDTAVIEMNKAAFAKLNCPKQMRLVPEATHLFDEPGALEQAAQMAAEWFERHFKAKP